MCHLPRVNTEWLKVLSPGLAFLKSNVRIYLRTTHTDGSWGSSTALLHLRTHFFTGNIKSRFPGLVSSRVVLQDVVIPKTHDCSEDFADVTTWRMWGMRHCPELARWVQCNHKSPSTRGAGRVYREEGQGQLKEAELSEGVAGGQGMLQEASSKSTKKRNRFSLKACRRNQLYQHSACPRKMTAHFWFPGCKVINLCYF